MKNLIITSLVAVVLLVLSACDPTIEDKITLGAAPQAAFSYEFIDPNNVRFTNTTIDEYFLIDWEFNGAVDTAYGNVTEVAYLEAGDYEVSLSVFGSGGSTTVTETITITQNDPGACEAVMQFLTDCGTKVWGLSPEAGALFVGPNDGSGTQWWANSADDVTDRSCDWNDDYTFTKDGNDGGIYDYDSKGDLWGEPYMGLGSEACYSEGDLPADRAAWGSGTHGFQILPATGTEIAKLRVFGEGAFLGLRKPANGAEVEFPQQEVVYDILEMDQNNGVLVIQVDIGGGLWRYRLAAK